MTATRDSLETLLMERALSDPELAAASQAVPDRPILPDVTVVKVGGQSLMDRGRDAVFPRRARRRRGGVQRAGARHRRVRRAVEGEHVGTIIRSGS